MLDGAQRVRRTDRGGEWVRPAANEDTDGALEAVRR
jgi:hypothetical protein